MEDGFRAIIKIPYWISIPRTYATASEVATLAFLRSKKIPVPEVYGWSSVTGNPVGVEYIIMEHVAGVGADTRIVDIEKKLFSIPFGALGSHYFKTDLPPQLQAPLYAVGTPDEAGDSQTYFIGPTADYMFWYGQRAKLDLDRGSRTDPKDYLRAIADKEVKWIEKYGKPLENGFPHNIAFPGLKSPQARYPKLFENPDPKPPSELKPPKYPPGYETMSPDEQAQVDELIRRQSLFYLYRVFNGGLNKVHLEALRDPLILQRQHLVDSAGRQWSGDIVTLRGALMRMQNLWSYLIGKDHHIKCPIDFSEQEANDQAESEQTWYNLNILINQWRDELGGLSEERWLPAQRYEAAVKRNKSLMAEFSDGASPDELEKLKQGLPFQGHDELY
ncbi:phosphotransferase enzyme family protein [Aspergillus luchuensis]|uniref:Phosphotransferase enzyme family protein n=1 Tax=Aspergillus kawachii TaxID=1069201 RepID=A0A146FID9_ASPKA|nr:phosphotransferase enzyme family protein [Aspergillus luchuensis]